MSMSVTAIMTKSMPMTMGAPPVSQDNRAGERSVHPRAIRVGGWSAGERHGRSVSTAHSTRLGVWHCQRTIIAEEAVNSARRQTGYAEGQRSGVSVAAKAGGAKLLGRLLLLLLGLLGLLRVKRRSDGGRRLAGKRLLLGLRVLEALELGDGGGEGGDLLCEGGD